MNIRGLNNVPLLLTKLIGILMFFLCNLDYVRTYKAFIAASNFSRTVFIIEKSFKIWYTTLIHNLHLTVCIPLLSCCGGNRYGQYHKSKRLDIFDFFSIRKIQNTCSHPHSAVLNSIHALRQTKLITSLDTVSLTMMIRRKYRFTQQWRLINSTAYVKGCYNWYTF